MVRPATLFHFYRRRLRVHVVQELFAGAAIAVAVALVLAFQAVNGGIGAAGGQNLRALTGDATLSLVARDDRGFGAGMRARIAALPGVAHAAALLEQGASVAYGGRRAQIRLLGADAELASLHALATRRIDLGRLQPGIVLPLAVAHQLALVGADRAGGLPHVRLIVRGRSYSVPVSAVLDRGMLGPLSRASAGFVSLASAQRLAHLPRRATRILVVPAPGRDMQVRAELERSAAGRLTVMSRDEELRAIAVAAGPIDSSTALVTAIGALVALLLAFTAMLPTLADRRQFVTALRTAGCTRTHVVQIVAFQAIVLGTIASGVGLLGGLLLARGAEHDLAGYLGFAFLLATRHALSWQTLVAAFAGGVSVSCLGAAPALVHPRGAGAQEMVLPRRSAHAVGAMRRAFGRRLPPGTLVLALRALRASSLLALALVTAGAVAVFAAIGMLGSQQSLLRGMAADLRGSLGTADVWISQPGDELALRPFDVRGLSRRVAAVGGVRGVRPLRGGLLDLGSRRVWVVARPPADRPLVPAGQIAAGDVGLLAARVQAGGWVAVSQQVADAQGAGLGDELRLPTPAGERSFRVAAITTNLGWGPGAVVMGARDYRRAWGGGDASALEIDLTPGVDADRAIPAIRHALGAAAAGLQVESSRARIAHVIAVARSGMDWSKRAARLLLIAAALAMTAAIGAGSWQRRAVFGQLRLMGWRSLKLWYMLLWEAALVLGAGCLVGAAAGIYGQYLGDPWLRWGIDYPTAHPFAIEQTVSTCLLVFALALAGTAVAGAFMTRTPPRVRPTPSA